MNNFLAGTKEAIIWLSVVIVFIAFLPLVMIGAFFGTVVGGLFSE